MTLFGVVGVLVLSAVLIFSLAASAELTDGPDTSPDGQSEISHRFIVELQSPPLAAQYKQMIGAQSVDGKLDANSGAAQSYIAQLQAEQAAFIAQLQTVLPSAKVSTYIDEQGISNQQTFQVVLNAVVVDAGFEAGTAELKTLFAMSGVKNVYRDYKYYPQLYTSTHLINAPVAWDMLGGQAMAGKGVKVASMDGGIHKDAPMFDGTGWSYPANFPINGLGLTSNNNGKIIASRAYFRWWDPPAPGDENPWPGVNGTPHGVHTASTAAGNVITDGEYGGTPLPTFSGVAPGAWVMSYRVFYASVQDDESFYTAEGLAALEDIVKDGADVVNNSWGGGPYSVGAPFDALDQALVNATSAGVFVSMSAGNSGPNPGTGDHPSSEYINVAASTTSGTYADGAVFMHAPEPVSSTLPFASIFADFGGDITRGEVMVHDYAAAAVVAPGNGLGCSPFAPNTFAGKTALIGRGSCEFGVKALNAQNAGADFVIIHNSASGGNSPMSMGGGAVGHLVTVPTIAIGNSAGVQLVAFFAAHPTDAQVRLNTSGFQAGNIPDLIASFSSRGPSTRNSLKPDIAAPGVNIMAQGYTPGADGEARHLGFGQASGTSMASPHVAGAAALLRQKYPTWSNAAIKSALMSTSEYMDIYNFNGSPAQPIDMGAGRLNVGAAMDPGVILNPPAADFGLVYTGTAKAGREIAVTNVSDHPETYNISTLYTGDGFSPTTSLAGVTVSPSSLTLNPGETKSFTVGFDPALGMGMDINQGYIVMEGSDHHAHLPFFARVVPMLGQADVLLMDYDASPAAGLTDYSNYYAATLDNLGVSYDYFDWVTDPDPGFADLMAYGTLVIFTGDNYFPVMSESTSDVLNEYVQAGGKVIAMGQDATWVGSFFGDTLWATRRLDSITDGYLPSLPIEGHVNAPPKFYGLFLDLTGVNKTVGTTTLSGLNETNPVTDSVASGSVDFTYDNFTGRLTYAAEVNVTAPITITAAHIHSGTVGVSGGVIFPTFAFTQPQYVTDTLSWAGAVTLTPEQNAQREAGGMYFNVHSSVHPGGEVRGQVPSNSIQGDGASNQVYIDEIYPYANNYVQPILRYPGQVQVDNGTVALALRENPSLENPGISNLGRGVFAAFGLEGVNNPAPSNARWHGTGTSREELLGTFLNYVMDEPTATISVSAQITTSQIVIFKLHRSSNIEDAYGWGARWDWGDGSEYTDWADDIVQHHYVECGEYTVRAEVDNTYGNTAIATTVVNITACEQPVSGTITAGEGGQLRSDDGSINVDFPAGAVSGDTTISMAKATQPSAEMTGLSFAGKVVSITAKDGNGNPVTSFAQPFTLVVKYSDSDWQNAGITDEANLNVYFYRDGAWTPLFPCNGCTHDMDKNEFVIKLDHLTEFAVAGAKVKLILPNVFK